MDAAAWLDLSNSESPEFIGRAVAALAGDSDVMRHSGSVLVAASVAVERISRVPRLSHGGEGEWAPADW